MTDSTHAQPETDRPDDDGGTIAASADEKALFGEKLQTLIQTECPRVPESVPVAQVIERMRVDGAGGVLICSDDSSERLVGIFTERDYLDKLCDSPELLSSPVAEFMTRDPETLHPEDTVGEAIRVMTLGGYRHLPIIDARSRPLGLVSVRNLVYFISEHFDKEVLNHPPEIHQTPSTQEGG